MIDRTRRIVAALFVPIWIVVSVAVPGRVFAVVPIAMAFSSAAAAAVVLIAGTRQAEVVKALPATTLQGGIGGGVTGAIIAYNWSALLQAVADQTVGIIRLGLEFEFVVLKPSSPSGVQIPSLNLSPYGKRWPDHYEADVADVMARCNQMGQSARSTFDTQGGRFEFRHSCVAMDPIFPDGWPQDGSVIPLRYVSCNQNLVETASGVTTVLGVCMENFSTNASGPVMMPVTYSEKSDGIKRFLQLKDGFVPDVRDADWGGETRQAVRLGHIAPAPASVEGIDAGTGATVKTTVDVGPDYYPRVTQQVTEVVQSSAGTRQEQLVVQSVSVNTLGRVVNHEVVTGLQADAYWSLWPADYAQQGTLARVATAAETLAKIGGGNVADPVSAKAEDMKKPLVDLLEQLKPFKELELDLTGSECPRPSFDAFGATYTIGAFCDFFDLHGSGLSAAMALFWALSSVVVVLRS